MKRLLLSITFSILLILAGLGVAKADPCPAVGMEEVEAQNCTFDFKIKVSSVARVLSHGGSSLSINGSTTEGGPLVNLHVSTMTSGGLGEALSDCMSLALQATKGNNRLAFIGLGNLTGGDFDSFYTVSIEEESPHSVSCQLI